MVLLNYLTIRRHQIKYYRNSKEKGRILVNRSFSGTLGSERCYLDRSLPLVEAEFQEEVPPLHFDPEGTALMLTIDTGKTDYKPAEV